jgi:hypothetical protein
MTHFPSFKAILIVSLLTPISGYTQEPAFRCDSETGAAIFSDTPCASDTGWVAPVAEKIPTAIRGKTVSQASKYFAAEEARTVAFGNRTPVAHRLPRDEATLKSVRFLTTSIDEMSVSNRRRALAGFAVYP